MLITEKIKKLVAFFCISGLAVSTALPVAAAAARQQNAPQMSTAAQLTKKLDNMVNTDEYYQVPGIGVIVYKDGQEVYSHFAGRAHIDEENPANDQPITRTTRYRIGSISKVFTGIGIMQLADQGKIRLDADAGDYLGFPLRNPNFPDTPITVRMLLAHTSSLRDKITWIISPHIDLRECFYPGGRLWRNGEWFASKKEPPGVYYSYCDMNCILLAAIIERLTGERFDKYQKEHVFKPLDTKADYVLGNLSEKEYRNLATIYRKCDRKGVWNEKGKWYPQVNDNSIRLPYDEAVYRKKYLFWQPGEAEKQFVIFQLADYTVGKNPGFFYPQGGVQMTLPELGNLLKLLGGDGQFRGRKILKPESLREMMTPQWTYDAGQKNGNTEGGALVKYGLTIMLNDGDNTARGCEKYPVNLVGHIGESSGAEYGAFIFADKPHDGFVFAVNGTAVGEAVDPRGDGKFSGNYIWEEMIMDAIIRAMVEDK